jgi:tetratricopeptide (TPR) repeat protein
VSLYERAIELDPGDAQPYYDLASAHTLLADWAGARAILERRLARVPRDGVAMYNLGAVEANAGDPEAAAVWWTRARETATSADLRARLDDALSRLGSGPEPPKPR